MRAHESFLVEDTGIHGRLCGRGGAHVRLLLVQTLCAGAVSSACGGDAYPGESSASTTSGSDDTDPLDTGAADTTGSMPGGEDPKCLEKVRAILDTDALFSDGTLAADHFASLAGRREGNVEWHGPGVLQQLATVSPSMGASPVSWSMTLRGAGRYVESRRSPRFPPEVRILCVDRVEQDFWLDVVSADAALDERWEVTISSEVMADASFTEADASVDLADQPFRGAFRFAFEDPTSWKETSVALSFTLRANSTDGSLAASVRDAEGRWQSAVLATFSLGAVK